MPDASESDVISGKLAEFRGPMQYNLVADVAQFGGRLIMTIYTIHVGRAERWINVTFSLVG